MSSCSLLPPCFTCARLHGVAPDVGWQCAAFEGGIPTEVLASVRDHRSPIDGDGGLTYLPRRGSSGSDGAVDVAWSESDHPRDEGGKFSAGSGGGAPAAASAPPPHDAAKRAIADIVRREGSKYEVYGLRSTEALGAPGREGGEGADDVVPRMATDPPVSEAQRRAMWAAAAGHSASGIPASVGREFASADPGGRLPARAKDMAPGKWATLRRLFGEWISEEQAEPEHAEDDWSPEARAAAAEARKKKSHSVATAAGFVHKPSTAHNQHYEHKNGSVLSISQGSERWSHRHNGRVINHGVGHQSLERHVSDPKAFDNAAWDSWERRGRAASVAFTTADGRVLLLRRAKDEENWPDTWAFPGGEADGDEDFQTCARREAREECGGDCTFDGMAELERTRTPNDYEHVTYVVPVGHPFEPRLSSEHSGFAWYPATDLPDPVHPGVRAAIDRVVYGDETTEERRKRLEGKLSERTREHVGTIGSRQRESLPDSDFLEPSEKKYPVKRDGKYDRSLLLAAAREARMHGRGELARRADAIREREFPQARDMAVDWDSVAEHAILAYDRSARSLDSDDRLHVDEANICQGKVDEYYGDEINGAMSGEPDWEPLDPKRRYKVFRDPEELAKPETVKSANGIPILRKHVPTDARDHKYSDTIGSTGTTARFVHPFIKNGLAFWPQEAIDGIDDGSKAQLSPGYRYRVDLTPGTFDGEPYDMRMHSIRFNHLAQVPQGRQGPGVVVPDADPDWRAWATLERAILDMGRAPRA